MPSMINTANITSTGSTKASTPPSLPYILSSDLFSITLSPTLPSPTLLSPHILSYILLFISLDVKLEILSNAEMRGYNGDGWYCSICQNKDKSLTKKWEELSRGTQEQLYFALRLGYAVTISASSFSTVTIPS